MQLMTDNNANMTILKPKPMSMSSSNHSRLVHVIYAKNIVRLRKKYKEIMKKKHSHLNLCIQNNEIIISHNRRKHSMGTEVRWSFCTNQSEFVVLQCSQQCNNYYRFTKKYFSQSKMVILIISTKQTSIWAATEEKAKQNSFFLPSFK